MALVAALLVAFGFACEKTAPPAPVPKLELCDPEKGRRNADYSLRRACPSNQNAANPSTCVLGYEDRLSYIRATSVAIRGARDQFRAASKRLQPELSTSERAVLARVEPLVDQEHDRMAGLGLLELNDFQLRALLVHLSRTHYKPDVRGVISDYSNALERSAPCFDFDISSQFDSP